MTLAVRSDAQDGLGGQLLANERDRLGYRMIGNAAVAEDLAHAAPKPNGGRFNA